MNLAPPHDIDPTRPSLYERIKGYHPGAANVVERIERRIQPFKFGISLRDINKQYKFGSMAKAEAFFKLYLRIGTSSRISDSDFQLSVNKTINVRGDGTSSITPVTSLRHIAKE